MALKQIVQNGGGDMLPVKALAVIPRELEYRKVEYKHGAYQFLSIPPVNSGTVTVPAGGGNETLFEITGTVHNWAKSNIEFTITPSGSGAGTYNYALALGAYPFARMNLTHRNGSVILADIQNFENFSHLVRFVHTKMDDFANADEVTNWAPVRAVGAIDTVDGRAVDATAAAGFFPVGGMEPRNWRSTIGGADTATPVLKMIVELGALQGTIFGMSKDFYFPQTLVLQIIWGRQDKVMHIGTNAANPETGAVAYAGGFAISGMVLNLAQQTNQALASAIRNTVENTDDFTCMIPVTKSYKTTTATTSTHAIDQVFTNGDGQTLQRVYALPIVGPEITTTAFRHSQAGVGSGIKQYQTSLNSNPLQVKYIQVNATSVDDWLLHKDLLKGGIIQNKQMYRFYWFHCEDFTGITPGSEFPFPRENLVSGLPLSNLNLKWSLNAEFYTDTQVSWYVYAVFTKVLSINRGVVTCS